VGLGGQALPPKPLNLIPIILHIGQEDSGVD
jgi:hypothetical protein